VHDAEGDRNAAEQNPQEVHKPRPYHRDLWFERLGVNNRRHRVGGVVKAVDALEQKGSPERKNQKEQRPVGNFHGCPLR